MWSGNVPCISMNFVCKLLVALNCNSSSYRLPNEDIISQSSWGIFKCPLMHENLVLILQFLLAIQCKHWWLDVLLLSQSFDLKMTEADKAVQDAIHMHHSPKEPIAWKNWMKSARTGLNLEESLKKMLTAESELVPSVENSLGMSFLLPGSLLWAQHRDQVCETSQVIFTWPLHDAWSSQRCIMVDSFNLSSYIFSDRKDGAIHLLERLLPFIIYLA